jgi:hypothetical protein
MVVLVMIGCEVGFWVFLLGGLAVRYLLGLRRLGAALLVGVPLVDLVLLVVTALDLRAGATARWEHGLAAVYLGTSVAYGHQMITWADRKFARRFAAQPAPVPDQPRFGAAHARRERRGWLRHALAWAVGCGLLLAAIAVVGTPARTAALWGWIGKWTLVLGVDFLWSFSYTVWPRKPKPERVLGSTS